MSWKDTQGEHEVMSGATCDRRFENGFSCTLSSMSRIVTATLFLSLFVFGTARAQKVEIHSDWVVTSETNPMDSVKTVSALRDSIENPAATLIIRCRGKQADVYVNAHEVISADNGVRVKFDDGKPVRQFWQRAASYDALFSPLAGDFLRSIKSAKKFYFEYSPSEKLPRVVSFDVSNLPESLNMACVNAEIDKADARARKAADARVKELAQQKENEQRLATLREKCSGFANESLDQVERSQSPLPPEECWEVLEWMHGAASYDELVKRRDLCKLPSFSNDPAFCGAHLSSGADEKAITDKNDQKLIIQSLNDPTYKSALHDNCSHKWFSDSHPRACEWVNAQTGK